MRETGDFSLKERPKTRKARKINKEELQAYIEKHPDHYLWEIAKRFNTTAPAVFYALKRMGISRKKNHALQRKVLEKRERFLLEISKISPEDRVYVDECGIDEILYRPYARGPKNARIYADISGKRVARTSVISAYSQGGFKAPIRFKGHTNTSLFNYWVETVLLPELRPGQVVIMDNTTFDKSPKTKALIESVECRLLYQPPYSPDLNKIEPMWANLKNALKSYQDKSKSFLQNLDQAILNMCPC